MGGGAHGTASSSRERYGDVKRKGSATGRQSAPSVIREVCNSRGIEGLTADCKNPHPACEESRTGKLHTDSYTHSEHRKGTGILSSNALCAGRCIGSMSDTNTHYMTAVTLTKAARPCQLGTTSDTCSCLEPLLPFPAFFSLKNFRIS